MLRKHRIANIEQFEHATLVEGEKDGGVGLLNKGERKDACDMAASCRDSTVSGIQRNGFAYVI